MIEARSFVEAARAAGFTHWAGVPCSFLTPFINYVIDDPGLDYVSAANEGDAVAIAAGAAIGGRRGVAIMQNSGLGNAVSPLTSLAWVFRIPLLLITTHRGAPGVHDEPQHELMGQITGELLDTIRVPWEGFPREQAEIAGALQRCLDWIAAEHRPYALLMQKGTVAPHALRGESVPRRPNLAVVRDFPRAGARPSRREALQRLLQLAGDDTVIIATTGYTGRELYALADRPGHFYMVGSMGCASSLGLGLARARPDLRVIVVDGDGAALMRMGNLATVGSYGASNLVHLVLDNGVHDSTGAQATVSENVDFAAVAASCGYGSACRGEDLTLIDELLNSTDTDGARFGHLRIRPGTIDNLPRPAIAPPDVLCRLMAHIGA